MWINSGSTAYSSPPEGIKPVRYMSDRAQICTNPDVGAAQIVTTSDYKCQCYGNACYTMYTGQNGYNLICMCL